MDHNSSIYPRIQPMSFSAEYYSEEEQKAVLEQRHGLNTTAADELYNLLKDMLPLKFTSSKQLSNYIIKNKLGYKYPNIAGIVRMEEAGREWNLLGGFPSYIYAVICDELELSNQRSAARPIGFTSFKEMQSRKRQH